MSPVPWSPFVYGRSALHEFAVFVLRDSVKVDINTDQGSYEQERSAVNFFRFEDRDWPLLISGPPAAEARGRLLLAHGAGAPMDSPFMEALCQALAAGGVRVLRFEFPFMAQRRAGAGRRPADRAPHLLSCWRAVWSAVQAGEPGAWAIGGKSLGGRMASLLADELAAAALVCLGYPFHPPRQPDRCRTEHLASLRTPTLIVQGARDPFGTYEEVTGYGLSAAIRLHWLASADHDFVPLKRSGHTQAAHLAATAQAIAAFLGPLTGDPCGALRDNARPQCSV